VFATPVTHVRDERLNASNGFASVADAYDWLAVAFTGCRGWLTGARGSRARALPASAWSSDAAHRVAHAAPLAEWSDEDVQAYVERWELLCKSD
jgi:3'-phosphoadenosine 5'-phosphosulfate sulfotransferase (PAPS reductase)/FAD synthetase